MPTPIQQILIQHGNAEIIEQWSQVSLELVFFENYFTKNASDNLDQASIVKLQRYLLFFSGQSFLSIKASHLIHINSDTLRGSLYPKIIDFILATNLKKPKRQLELVTKISNEIDKYFIKKSKTHAITQAYLLKIKNSEETAYSLGEKLAEVVNILIVYFLQAEKSDFLWPTNPDEVLANVLCKLTITNKISLNELAKLNAESISKIEHPIVKAYLFYLIALDRKIPPLMHIFSLEYDQLELFPLVANHALTVAQANDYSLNSLGRTILNKFIRSADWNNIFDQRRLIFIKSFLESDLFFKIEKSCDILDLEMILLANEFSGIVTKSGIYKSLGLRNLKNQLIEVVTTHLTVLYKPVDAKLDPEEKHPVAKSIDIGENVFKTALNQDIHTKIHDFTQKKSMSEHRNYFSRILQVILDTLTWMIKPLLGEEYRNRLFKPQSAIKLLEIEDNFRIDSPRRGSAA